MVEHEDQLRRVGGCLHRACQLTRLQDEIKRQSGGCECRQAAPDITAREPVGIGLGEQRMADASQELAAGRGPEFGHRVADARLRQICPADDCGDERAGARESEQLRSLRRLGDGLHHHGCRHARFGGDSREVAAANFRRNGASASSVSSHGCARTAGSQTWWCASTIGMRARSPAAIS